MHVSPPFPCVVIPACVGLSVCILKLMQDKWGDTALIKACQRGHVETATVLFDHGANVNHQNKVGKNTSIVPQC